MRFVQPDDFTPPEIQMLGHKLTEDNSWAVIWARFYVTHFESLLARAKYNPHAEELIRKRHEEAKVLLVAEILRGNLR